MPFSFKLAAMKLCSPSKAHLEEHYQDLAGKPFYTGLVSCEFNAELDMRRLILLMRYRHAERPHRRHGLGGP